MYRLLPYLQKFSSPNFIVVCSSIMSTPHAAFAEMQQQELEKFCLPPLRMTRKLCSTALAALDIKTSFLTLNDINEILPFSYRRKIGILHPEKRRSKSECFRFAHSFFRFVCCSSLPVWQCLPVGK